MKINIRGNETEVKFTFNSFKYMQDFDVAELEQIEHKPFRIVSIVSMLLIGGLNHNPKVKYTPMLVDEFLEEYVAENSITELFEGLMELLQDSNFFKSLQKNQPQEVAE